MTLDRKKAGIWRFRKSAYGKWLKARCQVALLSTEELPSSQRPQRKLKFKLMAACRTSDFWNYWLNFGISNKDGSGRGGRGIGRVTFLIASRLQSVIGYTRRSTDGTSAICGMSVLRAKEDDRDVNPGVKRGHSPE